MEEKVLKRLEEMAINPKGILPVCCVEDCDQIKIVIDSEDPDKEFYWVGKNDFSDKKIYDVIVESYYQLGIEKGFTQGISHTYCPKDLDEFLSNLK